jgi:hypothetical protein
VIQAAVARPGDGWLGPVEVGSLLSAYDIRVTRPHLVSALEDAGEAAADVGYPVHLARREPDRFVALGSPEALTDRWRGLIESHGPAALPLAVLAVEPHHPIAVRVRAHPQFGPLLEVTSRGCEDEPVGRLLPAEIADIESLLDEVIHTAGERLRRDVLSDVVTRLGDLVVENPEVVEVVIDSLDAGQSPGLAMGGHVRVGLAPGAWDDDTRHLRRDEP